MSNNEAKEKTEAPPQAGREKLEEDIMDLQALVPTIGEFLPTLFKEAVSDSLYNSFGDDTAKALMIMIGDTCLERPQEVFPQLDSILHDGSEVLKGAIRAEFGAIVHQLLVRATLGHFSGPDSISIEQEALMVAEPAKPASVAGK
ncbi:MAG TPA: hypothetical protein VEJ36_08425 [Nitrososphaerales archaeon]|nr:hypothetical protein [Nitrososphaerales archaeon]